MQHLRIGITGGMGVGKTTVCSIFERIGVPVYNADVRAKHLMQHETSVIQQIKEEFGWDAYNRKDELDREYLAKVVFNNSERLKKLNAIVHPAVYQDYEDWVNRNQHHIYSLKEAALLFESGSYKRLHKVIVVTCPIETRIERIVKRDHVRKEDVLKRIQNQTTDKFRLQHADYVIYNDGKRSLIEQGLHIHQQILALQDGDELKFKSNGDG